MDKWKALQIAGATMRDTSHGLRGERSSYLSDYMSQVREMEEQELQAKAMSGAKSAYQRGGIEGLMQYGNDNIDSDAALNATMEMGKFHKTMQGMQQPSLAEAISGIGNLFGQGSLGTGKSLEGAVGGIQGEGDRLEVTGGTIAGQKWENIDASLRQKREEKKIATEGQIDAQAMKMAEQTSRDYFRTTSAIDTTFDQALSFSDEQYQKWGVKPGDFLGLADKLTPVQMNQFKEAYVGSTREAAALVARLIIPQSRAIQMVDVFANSVSKIGSTIEANANNISATMQNGFANALANNMLVKDGDGNDISMQEAIIDPVTNKAISELQPMEKQMAINRIKREFGDELKTFYLGQAYVKNPNLLRPEGIQTLKEKAVKFNSVEEAQSQNLKPGTVVMINGKIGVVE